MGGGYDFEPNTARFRGVWIDLRPLPVRLKSFRPGIIMIHELAHIYADELRPADYEQRGQEARARADAGTATLEQQELAARYEPRGGTGDTAPHHAAEGIPMEIERSMQSELGYAQRTHYGVPITFPPGHEMTVAQFQSGSTFLYMDFSTYDVYTSTQDLFAALVRAGVRRVTPDTSFRRVRPGTPEYAAIRNQLL